jgi:hypothetical protein
LQSEQLLIQKKGEDTMWYDYVKEILLAIFKFAGLIVLGFALGKFLPAVFHHEDTDKWQLKIAVFLGLMGVLVAMLFSSHVALAGFALGMGISMLLGKSKKKEPPVEEKKEEEPKK